MVAIAACDAPTEPTTPITPGPPVIPSVTAFAFEAAGNPALGTTVSGVLDGDTVRVVLPRVVAVTALRPTFTFAHPATILKRGSAVQTNGVTPADFTNDLSYRLESKTGHTRTVVVKVTVFTGLPVVTITTDGGAPILNREDYVNAVIAIYGGKDRPEHNFTATTQIRGRGNSTWSNPKKPYRLRLTTSASLFGFPADRDWTLLANYWDQSLARNALAFKIGSMTAGIAYTPRCTPVELVLNGSHLGAYQLCEHIEVATNRVPATSSGWLLVVDDLPRLDPGDVYFHSPQLDRWSTESDPFPSVWVYRQPDPPTAARRTEIETELLRFEALLYGDGFAHPDTGYAKYLDVDATIDWYIVQELSKNNDAAFFKSVYVYKAPAGKITVGPLWDFDLAFGNYPFDGAPTGWKIRNAAWIKRLFEDRAFIDRLKTRWQALYARRAEVDQYIVDYTNALQLSQRLTHPMWVPYGPLPLLRMAEFSPAAMFHSAGRPASAIWTDADYAGEVSELRTWLNTRWAWLHTNIMDL